MKIELKDGKYTIDGQKYDSFQDIPEAIKQKYELEDRDGNGITDNFDAFHKKMKRLSDAGAIPTTIEINGKKYKSWDDIPPELEEQKRDLQAFMNKSADNWEKGNSSSNAIQPQYTPNSPSPLSSNSSMDGATMRWVAILIFLGTLLYLLFGDQIKAAIWS